MKTIIRLWQEYCNIILRCLEYLERHPLHVFNISLHLICLNESRADDESWNLANVRIECWRVKLI